VHRLDLVFFIVTHDRHASNLGSLAGRWRLNALDSLGILLRRLHHSSLFWRNGETGSNGINRFSLWIVVIILCLNCTIRVFNKDNSMVGSAGRRGAGFAKD
jgi:hypothetical protein